MLAYRTLLAEFAILALIAVTVGAVLAMSPALTDPAGGAVEDEGPTNGQIAFYSSRDGSDNIYVMNADGTGQTRLTTVVGQHAGPAWSPDGTQITFHGIRDGDSHEIYTMNADGSEQTRLTDSAGHDVWPSWSPDGTEIAFISRRDGPTGGQDLNEIYVMNADGTGETRITDNTSGEDYPRWSPDGSQIAFTSNRDGNWEIYVMNADGTGQTRITDNSAHDTLAAWSPDGTQMAFASDRDGDFDIYTMNSDGSGQTQRTSTFRSTYPAWSPDGTRIAFGTWNGYGSGEWEIFSMNADGSDPVNLTDHPGQDFSPAWGVVPSPVDETPPVVTVTTPVDGAEYVQGDSVLADHECTDDVTVDPSCVADPDVAVGTAIDTSTLGSHDFTVTGTDGAGNAASVTLSYEVVANTPPNKDACKRGGWESYTDDEGTPFKNQGDCVSYVATGGSNKAQDHAVIDQLLLEAGALG